MPVTPEGKIIDEFGNPTGTTVNPQTGAVITSSSLANLEPVNFKTYNPPPPEPIGGLEGINATTEVRTKQADELSERLLAANEGLLGKSSFEEEKRREFGVDAEQQALDDLGVRLRDLQKQEMATPLQVENEFRGRASVGAQESISQARRREIAIDALTVSSLIDATQNRLTSAERKVQRAVTQKYGPLLEEQAVRLANLDIILKSPQFTREEKARAEKQKLIEETKKQQLDAQKKDDEDRWKIAVSAASNRASFVPTVEYATLSQALDAIQNAPNKETALRISSVAGLTKTDVTAASGSLEEFKLVYGRDPSGVAELNAFTASRAAAGRKAEPTDITEQLYSGLSPATAVAVRARVGKFATEPTVENFATVQEGHSFAQSIPDITTNPADDQALIYSLAKALDPGSVVREGEYATAQKYAQSWVKAYGKGVTQAIAGTGFLSQEARRNIKNTIKQKYEASEKSYDNIYAQYTKGINALTGRTDGDAFLTEYKISTVPTAVIPEDDEELRREAEAAGVSIQDGAAKQMSGFWSGLKTYLLGK